MRLFVLLALLAVPLSTVAQPDPFALLDSTAARYQALTAYHFAGSMQLDVRQGDFSQSIDMPIVLAAQEPGRRRIQIENPVFALFAVSDGDATWVYAPSTNEYTKRDAATVGDKGVGAADLTQKYKRINDRVLEARFVSETDLELGGTTWPVWVVSVTYEDLGMGVSETPTTYWIDRHGYLVVQEQVGANQGGVDLVTTTSYTMVDVTPPLADSLFVFTPPEGATYTEGLDLPGLDLDDPSGTEAGSFTIDRLDGSVFSLDAQRGKVVVLDFWATWCGPCRKQMPHMQTLHDTYADQGLVIAGINQMETVEDIEAYLADFDFTFPILLDPNGDIGLQYGAAAIPTTVVIDRDGNIAAYLVGEQSPEALLAALRDAGIEVD